MTQTTLQPTKPTTPATINKEKINKYYMRFLNGEKDNIEKYLPSLLSKGGIIEREKYDVRIDKLKRKHFVLYSNQYIRVQTARDEGIKALNNFIQELATLKRLADEKYEATYPPY